MSDFRYKFYRQFDNKSIFRIRTPFPSKNKKYMKVGFLRKYQKEAIPLIAM